jgi:hypothetical protein
MEEQEHLKGKEEACVGTRRAAEAEAAFGWSGEAYGWPMMAGALVRLQGERRGSWEKPRREAKRRPRARRR